MGCCGSKKAKPDKTLSGGPLRESFYDKHKNLHQRGGDPKDPPPQPGPKDAKTPEEKKVLKVAEVDLNVEANALLHHTDKYEVTEKRLEKGEIVKPQLVVRRGTPFDINITFDRNYDDSVDDIKLIFDTSDKPRESKGTRVVITVSDQDKPREWGAKILKMEGKSVSLRIFTPPSSLVAKWTFKFDTIIKEENDKKVFRYTHPHEIYLLFNPWCPDDQVYMDDEQSRNEYVLNDQGRLYMGTQKQIGAKPWNFGQFEDFMLDCSFYLLDKGGLSYSARGNPVFIVRKISAVTNSPDDQGVLVGNWSGEYAGGKSPLSWIGSVGILEEFWRTLAPVKYGQCWVFSGVVTSLCRCLGIPARSVTNFASAHDVDGSITIDQHWTADFKPFDSLNDDSVWNFHVWNDVWTARPDLPSGFGGWQSIDATPQETSDGVYQAGPCSVEAMKNGLVNLPYDGPFVFAEVNADRLNWLNVEDGSWRCVGKVKNSIGKHISTKSPYSHDRLDVTYMYKFPEGSQQERTAVWRAIREGSTRKEAYEISIEDMKFDLVEKEDTMMGEPFDVRMMVTNNSKETRNVKVTLTATIVFYTGVPVCQIKSETFTIEAPEASGGEVKMEVAVKEYLNKLVDLCNIKISCMAQVMETKQFHCASDDFRLLKPELDVDVPMQVQVGEPYCVTVSFTNPLPTSLTNAVFTLEGAGLQKPVKIKQKNVPSKKEATMKTTLTARRIGKRELVVGFDAKEIASVTGQATINVVAAT